MSTGGRRIRVVHLITRMIVGGAQENTLASVLRVAPDRYESHLWTGPQVGTEGSLLDVARAEGAPVRVIPSLVREVHPLRDLAAIRDLTRRFRRGRFDIVHTHSSKAGILGRIAARRSGTPIVVQTAHGWGFHDQMASWLKSAYIAAERWTAGWTDCIVSVSHETTRVGLEAGIGSPDRYRLIRSGIPTDRFHPDPERRAAVRAELGYGDDALVLGSVGRLALQKSPLDFVAVCGALAPRFPKMRFLYVGDGPQRSEVERAVSAAGIADRFRITGVRSDVPDLLRALDLFTLTSLWEGLPRVVLQALATGVPVLAYDTAGIKEVVREGRNGHLVARGDRVALEERIAALVEAPDRLRAMGDSARSDLDSSFTEDEMIRQLERLYDELVERKLG